MSNNPKGNASTQPPSQCDELRELLPAYIIGATTEKETEYVRSLLPFCPELDEELAEYAMLAEQLTNNVAPQQPSAQLKASLMAAIEPNKDLHTGKIEEGKVVDVSDKTSSDRIGWWVAAAAVLILVASNIFWLMEVDERNKRIEILQLERTDLVNLLISQETQYVEIQSTENEEGIGTVIWNTTIQSATLFVEGLPQLSNEETYQLWLIDDNGPQSAGLFQVDPLGEQVFTFPISNELRNYAAIGISVEPASGSEQPTSDPIAVGLVEA